MAAANLDVEGTVAQLVEQLADSAYHERLEIRLGSAKSGSKAVNVQASL